MAAGLRVTFGNPTAVEVAAVVLAVDAAADAKARFRRPAWSRAARVEGLGHRLVVSPRDLDDTPW